MTTWNYRVIKKPCSRTQETTFQIHEVYYLNNGEIDCWNHTPVEPLGLSEPSLRKDIQAFLGAFRLPALEERYRNGKAKLVEERSKSTSADLNNDYAKKASRASDYINQILGNHLLLKQQPALRQAYDKVDQALSELYDIAGAQHDNKAETA